MDVDRVTRKIIGCAFRVSNILGVGFLERVYGNATRIELCKAGLVVTQNAAIRVLYDGIEVGFYIADMLVEERVIVELKVAKAIDPRHEAQVLNYLRATSLQTGLILNFGTPRLGVRRHYL